MSYAVVVLLHSTRCSIYALSLILVDFFWSLHLIFIWFFYSKSFELLCFDDLSISDLCWSLHLLSFANLCCFVDLSTDFCLVFTPNHLIWLSYVAFIWFVDVPLLFTWVICYRSLSYSIVIATHCYGIGIGIGCPTLCLLLMLNSFITHHKIRFSLVFFMIKYDIFVFMLLLYSCLTMSKWSTTPFLTNSGIWTLNLKRIGVAIGYRTFMMWPIIIS